MNNDRLILIKDIRSFTDQLYFHTVEVMIKEWNLNPTEVFDDYLAWVVAHILTTRYGLNVLNYRRKDNWHLCVFETIPQIVQDYFDQCITFQDVQMLKGSEIKILTTGYDLYIVRQMPWAERGLTMVIKGS